MKKLFLLLMLLSALLGFNMQVFAQNNDSEDEKTTNYQLEMDEEIEENSDDYSSDDTNYEEDTSDESYEGDDSE